MQNHNKKSVFISYSSKDAEWAFALLKILETKYPCWIAPRDIPAGESYASAIIEGINNAWAMILLLTPHSNESVQVEREIDRAVNLKIPVLPLRNGEFKLKSALEYYLCNCQWIHCEGLAEHDVFLLVNKALANSEKFNSLKITHKSVNGKFWPWFLSTTVLLLILGMFIFPILIEREFFDLGRPSKVKLTEVELVGLTAEELSLKESEILARRGFVFEEPDMVQHFKKVFWYKPLAREGSVQDINDYIYNKLLTEVEKENLALLNSLRKKKFHNSIFSGEIESQFPDEIVSLYFCSSDDVKNKTTPLLLQDVWFILDETLLMKEHVKINIDEGPCSDDLREVFVFSVNSPSTLTFAFSYQDQKSNGPLEPNQYQLTLMRTANEKVESHIPSKAAIILEDSLSNFTRRNNVKFKMDKKINREDIDDLFYLRLKGHFESEKHTLDASRKLGESLSETILQILQARYSINGAEGKRTVPIPNPMQGQEQNLPDQVMQNSEDFEGEKF